jgi:hypothetical protein
MKNKRIADRRVDFAMSSSTIIVLKTLAEHIAARLEERAFCVVFENDLERCWPRKKMARTKREREIQGFAESQGWTAVILDGAFGMRTILRKRGGSNAVIAER